MFNSCINSRITLISLFNGIMLQMLLVVFFDVNLDFIKKFVAWKINEGSDLKDNKLNKKKKAHKTKKSNN